MQPLSQCNNAREQEVSFQYVVFAMHFCRCIFIAFNCINGPLRRGKLAIYRNTVRGPVTGAILIFLNSIDYDYLGCSTTKFQFLIIFCHIENDKNQFQIMQIINIKIQLNMIQFSSRYTFLSPIYFQNVWDKKN